jgi:hypothetical protein
LKRLTPEEFEAVVQALREAGFADGIDMAASYVKSIEIPPEAHEVAIEALRKYRELHE